MLVYATLIILRDYLLNLRGCVYRSVAHVERMLNSTTAMQPMTVDLFMKIDQILIHAHDCVYHIEYVHIDVLCDQVCNRHLNFILSKLEPVCLLLQ